MAKKKRKGNAPACKWWNFNKTMSYNAFLNFIVGIRGPGKTYGSKKWAVQHFKRTGEKFIWVRRFKTELSDAVSDFFAKVQKEFPNDEFIVKPTKRGFDFFCNKQLCGKGIALSTSRMKKGTEYEDFTSIFFDEFLIDKGVYHYLPREVPIFLDLIDTVFRQREDVRVFCMANTISVINPYFLYWHLTPPEDTGIICKDDILIERVAPADFVAEKEKSRFGRLIAGTEYGDFNMHGVFTQDSPDFIEKKSGNCRYLYTIIYKGKSLGVWANYETGKMFVSRATEKDCSLKFVLTLDDLTPNTLLLSTLDKNYYMKKFMLNLRLGNIRAEDQEIKSYVIEIAGLLRSV